MIEFDDLYLADVKDDFEEAGRNQTNFDLWDFINKDLSRAFAVGYLYTTLMEDKDIWIPVSIRKQMRRMNEGLDIYNPQLKWINEKYGIGKRVNVREYVSYVFDNVFIEDYNDLLKLAVVMGVNLSQNE